jgi:fermentation-respiration switch protein FrsA (DUF1100 family)
MGGKILFQLLLLFFALGLVFFSIRYIERRTLFYPSRNLDYSPAEAGLVYEDVYLRALDNTRLFAWFIPSDSAKFTILFCHGNAGNISHRIEKLKFFHQLGCNVFIFDYRGYGKSQGRPFEKGLYLDVKAAYDYLLSRRIKANQIIGYGESLGNAVIVDLASKNRIAALIIDSGFSRGKDMASRVYPFIPYWIFSSRWDCSTKIKSINVPKLIIHSVNDEIVPFELGRKVYESAAPPKEFLEIHGGHNSCFFESEDILKEKIKDFLNKLNKPA